jgi:hypothetical protein
MNIRHRAPERNNSECITQPFQFSDLLANLPAVPRVPSSAAGLHLHRRHHVGPGIADLVAALNGLGIEEARQ